jgi:hypothetical protein
MLDRHPSEDCIVAAKVREACTVAEKRMGEQIFLDRESLPDIHLVESRRACFSSLWFTGFWSLLSLFFGRILSHTRSLYITTVFLRHASDAIQKTSSTLGVGLEKSSEV